MADTLASLGARVVSGGTDNHMMLVDVTPLGVTGKEAEHLLDEIGITVNKNAIPFDPLPPNTASGIRIGTPATTSRGFGPDEMQAVARIMAETLAGLGARVVSGGTDNHLLLVDVTPLGVTGKEAEHLLDDIGITVNKNAIPFDKLPPNTASGIRIGTPATTSRGFGGDEMRTVARIIIDAIRERDDPARQERLAAEVREIVDRFPVPGLPTR
jgi:glycine/serine hydroxymethyltransferase